MPGSLSIWKMQWKKQYESAIQARKEVTPNNSAEGQTPQAVFVIPSAYGSGRPSHQTLTLL